MAHDIIMISAEPWENYTWRRRHHVSWELAKSNRVLFVEPPLTVLQPFREINLSWKHLLNLGRLKHQGRELYSYSPLKTFPLFLPFSKKIDYDKWNREGVVRGVKKAIRKLGFKKPILWVNFSQYQYDYYGEFDEKLIVTDWYDMFVGPKDTPFGEQQTKLYKKIERRILDRADIIFAVSKELEEYVKGNRGKVFLIPHGIDVESFKNKREIKESFVKKLVSMEHPIIGYMGIMHNKIDFELLNYIAEKRPNLSMLLIGKEWLTVEKEKELFKQLAQRKNILFAGELSKDDIPAYLNLCDVCLMPFKKSEFNKATTGPLKLWQYLAAGKPIVAVDQGTEFDCKEFVYKAQNNSEFVSMIDKSLKEDNEDLIRKRQQIAFSNSWEKRVDEMMSIINRHLNV